MSAVCLPKIKTKTAFKKGKKKSPQSGSSSLAEEEKSGFIVIPDFIAVNHMGEKPFTCQICGMVFKSNANRWRHNRKIHQGLKFHCSICANEFSDKKAVRRHILNVHHGIKRH